MALPAESSYKTLARALAPLEDAGTLRYLPKFECCGSCAWYRIGNEDWGTAQGFVMFNEQTKERADDICELMLTVAGFEDEADGSVRVAVREALIAGGFELIAEPADSGRLPSMYSPDFGFNRFYEIPGGFAVWGWFDGKAKRLSGYKGHRL